ncbi:hypothetical protein GCM10025734_27140 [Kitasatospora paranensis]
MDAGLGGGPAAGPGGEVDGPLGELGGHLGQQFPGAADGLAAARVALGPASDGQHRSGGAERGQVGGGVPLQRVGAAAGRGEGAVRLAEQVEGAGRGADAAQHGVDVRGGPGALLGGPVAPAAVGGGQGVGDRVAGDALGTADGHGVPRSDAGARAGRPVPLQRGNRH